MIPANTLPDHDLISCSTFGFSMTTANIHPIYLPPVVCWINESYGYVKRIKCALFTLLKVMSTLLIAGTLLLHAAQLRQPARLGVLGTIWSIAVCGASAGGLIVAVLSSHKLSVSSDINFIANPTGSLPVDWKLYTCSYLWMTYTLTLCHTLCVGGARSRYHNVLICSQGPDHAVLLLWTWCVFIWINAVGWTRTSFRQC